MTLREQEDNKFLFSYLKDDKYWRTEHKLNSCIYHNPLNSSVYGLMFHRQENWLNAVEDKIRERITDSGFTYITRTAKQMDFLGRSNYCMIAETQGPNEDSPTLLAHVHGDKYLETKRVLLVEVIVNLLVSNRSN